MGQKPGDQYPGQSLIRQKEHQAAGSQGVKDRVGVRNTRKTRWPESKEDGEVNRASLGRSLDFTLRESGSHSGVKQSHGRM